MVETRVQEDVYEMSYYYNAESRNPDVFDRSVAPMVAHLLEGYNVNIIVLGSRLWQNNNASGGPGWAGYRRI
jgi:hypothetical protein